MKIVNFEVVQWPAGKSLDVALKNGASFSIAGKHGGGVGHTITSFKVSLDLFGKSDFYICGGRMTRTKIDKTKAENPFSYYCTDYFARQYHIADGETDVILSDRELVVLDHMLWAERTKVRTDEDYLFIMDLDRKIWKAHNKIWGVKNDN